MSKPNEHAITEKIRKLLALAGNNPNENERNRAMEMAEKLMAEHNLEMSKIFLGDADKSAIGNFITDISGDSWERFIGRAVAELYFCKLYLNVQYNPRKETFCALVGTEINRQIAYEMALWLIATIKKEAKDTFFGKSDQEDFCFGAAQIVEKRAKEIIENKKREGMAAPTGDQKNALMVLRKDTAKANDDWYNRAFPGSGFVSSVSTRHSEAAGAGKAFGAGIGLERGVGSKAAPKRIQNR